MQVCFFTKHERCNDSVAELFAPWAQAVSNVHVSVLAKEEMKRMIERETRGFSTGPMEECKSERWKTKRARGEEATG